MPTPFENFRTKLREAGCRVEIGDQFKSTHGSNVSLLLVYPEGGGMVRALVIDERNEGYHLFIEQVAPTFKADVLAILRAAPCGRLEKA